MRTPVLQMRRFGLIPAGLEGAARGSAPRRTLLGRLQSVWHTTFSFSIRARRQAGGNAGSAAIFLMPVHLRARRSGKMVAKREGGQPAAVYTPRVIQL